MTDTIWLDPAESPDRHKELMRAYENGYVTVEHDGRRWFVIGYKLESRRAGESWLASLTFELAPDLADARHGAGLPPIPAPYYFTP